MKTIEEILNELNYPKFQETDRPSVIETFIGVAFQVSLRSPDAQTKHGCVIADKNYRIISTGYNGFPRDIDYSSLPNVRPEKYSWMKHAEKNALLYCPIRPENCIAFVTGECCFDCLTDLWQAGIEHVYEANRNGHFHTSDKAKLERQLFLKRSGMRIDKVEIPEFWKTYLKI